MDFATVVIDRTFWATTCVQVRGEPALRNALYEWADWEEDRGDPFRIATGLRLLADYEYGVRSPWDIRTEFAEADRDNPWQWSRLPREPDTEKDKKHVRNYKSYLSVADFTRLTPVETHEGRLSFRAKYPTPLAAYLDACYAVDPDGLPLSERRPYQ